MSINPSGANSYGWNYSKPDKPGYSTQLIGTVLAIQEVQKMGFTMNGQPGMPEFWPDGHPKMNIRLALATPEGELKTFTFQPAGKQARMGQKKSVHMDLFALTGNTDMLNLIGKTICIQTQEGHYGQGNPRPWYVSLVEGGPYKLNNELPSEFKAPQVLANNAVSGGQMMPPQQQGYGMPMQQQPMQQGYGMPMQQQPMMQQRPPMQQMPMQAPVQQQPMQQMPVQAPVQQQPTTEGMDPQVANAMIQQAKQVFGDGVQVTMESPQKQGDPVGTGQAYTADVYDEDMPF